MEPLALAAWSFPVLLLLIFLRVPIGLPAPAWLVRAGAPLVMRTDPELAIYGRYVVSRRLKELGFEFKFPTLSMSLDDLWPRRRARSRGSRVQGITSSSPVAPSSASPSTTARITGTSPPGAGWKTPT